MLSCLLADILRSHVEAGRENEMTTARTKAATTSASFGTRILTQCIPGPVSGGCAESNRDARECGLKTRGLRSTLELEAGKFYRRWERVAGSDENGERVKEVATTRQSYFRQRRFVSATASGRSS